MPIDRLAAALAELSAALAGPAQPGQPTRGGAPAPLSVHPAGYVTVELAATVTGYTEKAIRRKIADGVWREGKVWRKAPDGRVLVSLAGYARWVEGR